MPWPPSNNWIAGGGGGGPTTPVYTTATLVLPDGTTPPASNPDVTNTVTYLVKPGTGDVSGTLPAGASDGQLKIIAALPTWVGGKYDLTVTGFAPPGGSGTTLRFTAAGQSVTLIWASAVSGWLLTNGGAEVV